MSASCGSFYSPNTEKAFEIIGVEKITNGNTPGNRSVNEFIIPEIDANVRYAAGSIKKDQVALLHLSSRNTAGNLELLESSTRNSHTEGR